jgi:hypothetical protein
MKEGSPPDSGEISGPDENKQMSKAGSYVNHHYKPRALLRLIKRLARRKQMCYILAFLSLLVFFVPALNYDSRTVPLRTKARKPSGINDDGMVPLRTKVRKPSGINDDSILRLPANLRKLRGSAELSEPPCVPVAHWSFDNRSDLAHDDSGNGNNGSLSGVTWTSEGRLGGALEFNGQNSKVIVADSASFSQISTKKRLTIDAWFVLDSLPFDHNPIMAKWGGGDHDDEWKLNIRGNVGSWSYGKIALILNSSMVHGSPNTELISSVAPSWGEWHHVTATWDGEAELAALYLDGTLVDCTNSAITTMPDTGQEVSIGYAHIASGAYKYFDGTIDEVKIYDCALLVKYSPLGKEWAQLCDMSGLSSIGSVRKLLKDPTAELSLIEMLKDHQRARFDVVPVS